MFYLITTQKSYLLVILTYSAVARTFEVAVSSDSNVDVTHAKIQTCGATELERPTTGSSSGVGRSGRSTRFIYIYIYIQKKKEW
jgi:hypothetical protein